MSSSSEGALAHTLEQMYMGNSSVGYVSFNDEPLDELKDHIRIGSSGEFEYGHSKGVVGWDKEGGFWVVHSFPKFPSLVANGYSGVDASQLIYGQSALCVSVDFSTLNVIGDQLQYNHPDVYDLNVPVWTPPNLASVANGVYYSTPSPSVADFMSIGAIPFVSFSKTAQYGQAIYQNLVAPGLNTSLLVETWIRGDRITSFCPGSGFSVQNIKTLVFPSGLVVKETQDHSKWAISSSTAVPAVCIGGINQMTTQNMRGGGTVCMWNQQLWLSIFSMVGSIETC